MNRYKSFITNLEKVVSSSGRNLDEIEVIAVSKKKSAENIREVINQNHRSFGENQIQEIEKKWPDLRKENKDIKLNFVGSIQSRKVESIFNYCDVIHSIDRMKIVKMFAELEMANNQKKEYFIQINTGNEPQKSGVLMSQAEQFISECKSNYSLNIVGLMCLPPINQDPKDHFMNLKDLARNFKFSSLSMGMSGDYEVAIECGSTHIRIGTHIFGERIQS